MNSCGSNPYKSLNESEILAELSESRILYDSGEGEELGKVINEIGEKYDLYGYYYTACK